mmetsp:Transcript_39201/g.42490  ORF Transcript_39201/g.42490 Transcript_39201/m.42490 type:complete len:124 (-) Transcript_39201:1148-1519(-)
MTFTMEIYYCHGEDRREWESAWFVSGNEVRTHNHSQIVVWRKECSDRPFFLPNKNRRKERDDRKNLFSNQSYGTVRTEMSPTQYQCDTHTHTHTQTMWYSPPNCPLFIATVVSDKPINCQSSR